MLAAGGCPAGRGTACPGRQPFVCAAACATRHPRHPLAVVPAGSDFGGTVWPDAATELRLPWGGVRIMDVHRWTPRVTLALSRASRIGWQARRGLDGFFIEVIYIIPTI